MLNKRKVTPDIFEREKEEAYHLGTVQPVGRPFENEELGKVIDSYIHTSAQVVELGREFLRGQADSVSNLSPDDFMGGE